MAAQAPSLRSSAKTPFTKDVKFGWALLIAIPYGSLVKGRPTILVFGSWAASPRRIVSSVLMAST